MSVVDKFTTFAFTLRPRTGVTDEQIKTFVSYIKRNCDYYYVITEKKGVERHIHSAFHTKKPSARSNVQQQLHRLFPTLDPEEKSVMNKGLKILYSDDFLNRYMDKDDDTVVIERNLPENGSLEAYYPVKKEQSSRALAFHSELLNLESLWHEYMRPHVDVNTVNVRDFLFKMMYQERKIGIIFDDKRTVQYARHLVRWMNRVDSCKLDLPPFEKEEGPGYH